MSRKREAPRKHTSRKTLDPRVEDLRKKSLHLDPYSGWFPAGATKRIMSIVDAALDPIGELETGSDGFVQRAVLVGRRFVRISYYPGQPYAALTWITLEKYSTFRPSQIRLGFWHTVIYRLKASRRIVGRSR